MRGRILDSVVEQPKIVYSVGMASKGSDGRYRMGLRKISGLTEVVNRDKITFRSKHTIKTFTPDRICPICSAKLSVYNYANECACHKAKLIW